TSSNIGPGSGLPVLAVAITLAGALLLVRTKPTAASLEVSPVGARPADEGFDSTWSALLRPVLLFGSIGVVTALIAMLLIRGISLNAGTGFPMLVAAFAVLLSGAVMTFRFAAVLLLVAALALGFAAEWAGGKSQTWLGPPYRRMALDATDGGHIPNINSINEEVARAIGGRRTLLVRDDAILNANGLAYSAAIDRLPQSLIVAPFGNAR